LEECVLSAQCLEGARGTDLALDEPAQSQAHELGALAHRGPAPLRWIPATSSLPRLLPQIELLRDGGARGSGGPPGERNGQYRHAERTKAAIAERKKFSALLKMLRAGLT